MIIITSLLVMRCGGGGGGGGGSSGGGSSGGGGRPAQPRAGEWWSWLPSTAPAASGTHCRRGYCRSVFPIQLCHQRAPSPPWRTHSARGKHRESAQRTDHFGWYGLAAPCGNDWGPNRLCRATRVRRQAYSLCAPPTSVPPWGTMSWPASPGVPVRRTPACASVPAHESAAGLPPHRVPSIRTAAPWASGAVGLSSKYGVAMEVYRCPAIHGETGREGLGG